MTIDDLQQLAQEIRAAHGQRDKRIHALAAVVDELVYFAERDPTRHLTNAGITEQSMRDRDVVRGLLDEMRQTMLTAAGGADET